MLGALPFIVILRRLVLMEFNWKHLLPALSTYPMHGSTEHLREGTCKQPGRNLHVADSVSCGKGSTII